MDLASWVGRAFFLALALTAAPGWGQQPPPRVIDPGQLEKQFEKPPEPAPSPEITIPPVPGQQVPPGADTLRFVSSKISVDGATVYSDKDFAPYFQDYLGREISLGDVYRVAAALTRKYREDGYILSQVVVPAQRVADGVIRLTAVEGYIDQVRIEGDVLGSRRLLDAYADKIKNSRPLRLDVLERYLLLMNDLGGTVARGTLSPSAQPGAADLTIVISHDRLAGGASINNRGSRFYGPWRADLATDFYSLFGRYDRTGFRVVTTGGNDELHFAALSHDQPVGTEGARLGASFSGSESDPGFGAEFPTFATSSRSAVLALTYPVIRSRARNLYARGAFTYYNGETDANGLELSEDRLRAIRVAAVFDMADRWRGTNVVEAELSQGLNVLDASETGSPNLSRPGGHSDFTKLTLYLARLQFLLPRWTLFAAVIGQYAFNDLLSPEEFAFGGEQFGRAYDAAEIVGDSGAALKLELRYSLMTQPRAESTLYGFYDIGGVWRRNPGFGVDRDESAAAAGLGIRLTFAQRFGAYVEIAKPLTRIVTAEGDDDLRLFGAVTVAF
jgi:hemolysin activation/secretion protein